MSKDIADQSNAEKNLLDQVQVVLDTEEVVAVNKPAGLVVHADGRTDEPNLCDWVLDNYPAIKGVGEALTLQDGREIARPGIVHRLDRETSGVLVIAKTQKSFDNLKGQFKKRQIKKKYYALVYGQMDEREGEIDSPIGRSANDFRQWTTASIRGKKRAASTKYYVRKTSRRASFLEVQPRTGRTHQIRVHAQSIGHPIVCDSLYAPGRQCLFGLSRQALHASQITYSTVDGSKVTATAESPEDFTQARQQLAGE